MKFRIFAFAITMGLGLLLALVVVAQGAEGTGVERTAPRAAAQNATSLNLDESSQITFTPAYTTFLPLVVRNHEAYLYFDDFDDPTSGWYVGDSEEWAAGYLAGEYQILLKKPLFGVMVTAGFSLPSGYRIEADARLASSNAGTYGLVFGTYWSGGTYEGYQFIVNPTDRTYTLQKRSMGGSWTALIDWTDSAAIQPGTASNHLRVDRIGDAIQLYVNGTLVATFADGSFTGPGRGGGLRTHSGETPPVDIRFDNLVVYPAP